MVIFFVLLFPKLERTILLKQNKKKTQYDFSYCLGLDIDLVDWGHQQWLPQ